MDPIIYKRAQILFDLCKEYLLEIDGSDADVGEGYRFSYLLLRGPKNFLNAFHEGDLALDQDGIQNTLARFRRDLPDQYPDLHGQEREILNQHNYEVRKLKSKDSSFLPTMNQYH